MSRCYKYAIARFSADRVRGESLNIGIVAIRDNTLDVRLPKSFDKLRAISGALDLQMVRDSLEALPSTFSYIMSQGGDAGESIAALSDFSPVCFSSLGEFFAVDEGQYNICINRLLKRLVEPEPAGTSKSSKPRATKLLNDVKSAFNVERVMARKGEGLDAHRIVPNHKIAEGLSADFLLKNGSMHVVQTVDASSNDASIRMINNVAKSALVFEQARMQFGAAATKSKLIYKASSALESFITPSLEAAEHQGATLVNWESRDDRTKFIVEMSSLAEPLADLGQRSSKLYHASVQPKFKLN